MTVPPPHNLIVRAIPLETPLRRRRLAAAACWGALCGAASAQSAPVAPPLNVYPAVELHYAADEGKTWMIEQSADLRLWSAAGPVLFGTGETVSRLLPVAETALSGSSEYFRVKEETLPATGRARWSMEGCSMLVNTPEGLTRIDIGANGQGSATNETGTRAFSWGWQRSGMDTGCLTMTGPDGTQECAQLAYQGDGTGVYVSRTAKDGVPLAATTGTFRPFAGELPGVEVPASPGNALIVFAGTGRPVSVRLTAGGAAAISSPAGDSSYSSHYVVTGPAAATLTLECQDGFSEHWTMVFTGPGCGTFASETRRYGQLRRSGRGSFTMTPLTQP